MKYCTWSTFENLKKNRYDLYINGKLIGYIPWETARSMHLHLYRDRKIPFETLFAHAYQIEDETEEVADDQA